MVKSFLQSLEKAREIFLGATEDHTTFAIYNRGRNLRNDVISDAAPYNSDVQRLSSTDKIQSEYIKNIRTNNADPVSVNYYPTNLEDVIEHKTLSLEDILNKLENNQNMTNNFFILVLLLLLLLLIKSMK